MVVPDIVSYASALAACGQAQRWIDAVALLQEAQHLQLQTNIVALSSAISACEKAGQWLKALQLLGDMQTSGIEPSTIAYNAAISACEKSCRWTHALSLFSEMASLSLSRSAITQSASIAACARGRAWEQALWLLGDGELLHSAGSEMFAASASTISACEIEASWEAAQKVPAILAGVSRRLLESRAGVDQTAGQPEAQVLSMEILSDFDALSGAAFRTQGRRLWGPVVTQCRGLCGYQASRLQSPPACDWRLSNPVLESESFLGASLTGQLFQHLHLAPEGALRPEPWLPAARAAARTAPALTSCGDAQDMCCESQGPNWW